MNTNRFLVDTNVFILLYNDRLAEPLPAGRSKPEDELKDLNAESAKLAATIKKNFEELGI